MRRARTSDWEHASLLYRGLHRTIRAPVAAACRANVRGLDAFYALGDRGAIVAANHASAWDPVVINAVCPRQISWIAKREAFDGAIANWFFRGIGSIPVDRQRGGNVEALAEAVRAIEEQRRLVGIFPEGTRGDPRVMRAPHRGVARLALLTGAPVLPVGVAAETFLPRGRVAPRFRERVWVRIGAPVEYERDAAAANDPEATRKIAEDVMARIGPLAAEAVAGRERGERWGRP